MRRLGRIAMIGLAFFSGMWIGAELHQSATNAEWLRWLNDRDEEGEDA